MNPLYLDIETIPCQAQSFRDEIAKPIVDATAYRISGFKAEIEQLKPPSNYKDPAKIADWTANELPKKKQALEAQIKACEDEVAGKVDEAWRRTSFDGALCQIVCIGSAIGDANPLTLHSKPQEVLSLKAEGQLLRSWFAALELAVPTDERHALIWVGHNVIDFDLRIIYQRSVVHGIRPPYWIPFDSKPWGDRVYDTMLGWAGNRGRVGLDKLCRILGIDAKGSELGDEIDGSKVWDFVKEGRIKDVATYCAGDVHRAREAHRRLTFWQPEAALKVVA